MISKNAACALLIGFVFVGKIFAVLHYGPDYALFVSDYNRLFCPEHCWTFPENVPYSVLWSWMNPLALGRFWYGVYIVIFDALTCLAYWFFVKRVPHAYLALLQAMSIMFYLGQGSEYQNVTIIVFFPLAFFSLKTLLIPILIKLPLGWSYPWNLSDLHVQCVWYCSGFTNNHLTTLDKIPAFITNYGMLIGAFFFTIRVVQKLKNRERDKIMRKCGRCTKYWNKDSVHFQNCKQKCKKHNLVRVMQGMSIEDGYCIVCVKCGWACKSLI